MHRRIRVTAYSGGRAEERPGRLHLDEVVVDVEVVERWVEEDFGTGRRRRHFRLRDREGYEYRVYQEEDSSEWFLRV